MCVYIYTYTYIYIYIYIYIVLKPPYGSSHIIAPSTNDVIVMLKRKRNVKKYHL